jgi:predicted DsbA family dithiol-disulfide isomerase
VTVTALRIDVWSDIACPWCFVGKRRLESALATFPHPVELVFRSFELDPNAPRLREGSQIDLLATKYRLPRAQAQAMVDRMIQTGAGEGIEFRYDKIRGGNTFDAHRLLHLAKQHGKQIEMKERLLRGYFSEGVPIGEPSALVPLAVELGFLEAEVRALFDSDRFASEVRADEQLAGELGINGVPFFVMAGRLGVSGAQTPDVLLGALNKAREDVSAAEATDAPACDPDHPC